MNLGVPMERYIKAFDKIIHRISLGASCIFLLIMCIITYEVVARYVFNRPTSWGWVINEQLFLITTLFGGIYAAMVGGHIRIEVFYEHFSRSGKLISKIFTLILFVSFMGALIWKGWQMAEESVLVGERATGIFRLPLYPVKMLIPVVAVLFLIQGLRWIFKEKNS